MRIDNRNNRKYCEVCRELVVAQELRQQDGVMKCQRCLRTHSIRNFEELLNTTNAAVPVLAKFGGEAKIFRE